MMMLLLCSPAHRLLSCHPQHQHTCISFHPSPLQGGNADPTVSPCRIFVSNMVCLCFQLLVIISLLVFCFLPALDLFSVFSGILRASFPGWISAPFPDNFCNHLPWTPFISHHPPTRGSLLLITPCFSPTSLCQVSVRVQPDFHLLCLVSSLNRSLDAASWISNTSLCSLQLTPLSIYNELFAGSVLQCFCLSVARVSWFSLKNGPNTVR